MAKETAEQKLLKIIETTEAEEKSGENKEAPSQGDPEAQAVAKSVQETGVTISIPPLLANILSFAKGPAATDKGPVTFGLKEVNNILLVAVVIISVLFLKDFIQGMNFSQKEIQLTIDTSLASRPEITLPQVKEVAEYLATVTQRNLFQPFEKKVEEDPVVANLPPKTKLILERTKNLKLVGVSWLDTPESASALIENTESGITYFLKTGEMVNNVNVKEIFAESVILSFQDEEVELKL